MPGMNIGRKILSDLGFARTTSSPVSTFLSLVSAVCVFFLELFLTNVHGAVLVAVGAQCTHLFQELTDGVGGVKAAKAIRLDLCKKLNVLAMPYATDRPLRPLTIPSPVCCLRLNIGMCVVLLCVFRVPVDIFGIQRIPLPSSRTSSPRIPASSNCSRGCRSCSRRLRSP
jgi:hypothetical protein